MSELSLAVRPCLNPHLQLHPGVLVARIQKATNDYKGWNYKSLQQLHHFSDTIAHHYYSKEHESNLRAEMPHSQVWE